MRRICFCIMLPVVLLLLPSGRNLVRPFVGVTALPSHEAFHMAEH